MSIDQAEKLKRELTDKYVVVAPNVPELRRFEKLTGQVRTVNMNCRALVEFDGPVDITWYDIDPQYLTVVDGPRPKETPKAHAAEKTPAAADKKPAAAKPAGAKPAAGMSPLELARQQGAAGAKPAVAGGEKKLSPLELARQQGAAKSDDGGKKLSPLEQARLQGAVKSGASEAKAEAAPAAEESPAEEAAPAAEAAPAKKESPPASTAGLSPLELARQQGAFKGNK